MAETGNETCGYGGWTLVMKINGNKVSFQSFRGRGSLFIPGWTKNRKWGWLLSEDEVAEFQSNWTEEMQECTKHIEYDELG